IFCLCEFACELDDRRRARRVVIGAVMYLRRVRRETSRTAVTEMIVMRTDDDGFVLELRVRAFENADDVVRVYGFFGEVDFDLRAGFNINGPVRRLPAFSLCR